MNFTFFLGSECLGSMPVADSDRLNLYIRGHHALSCPKCGEVWARLWSDEPDAEWTFHRHSCRRCNIPPSHIYAQIIPGSFLNPWWWKHSPINITNPALPDAVVRWEFAGIVPFIEKELAQ